MSLLAALLIATADASAAPTWPPPVVSPWWNPAREYVTAGQDEPGYRAWMARQPMRRMSVASFHGYLDRAGVAYVVPTWQLLRTATDWQRCGAEPFAVPPASEWANVVQTLRYVRDYVIPAVGPVEPVSSYRSPALNRCAGGAPNSVHQHLSAVDLVPLRPTGRDAMMARLCPVHALEGPRYAVGLGFYAKLRFHVDSWKFRTWGRNDGGSVACARSYEIAHRSDVPPTVAAASTVSAAPASPPGPKVILAPSSSAPDPLAPLK